MRYSFLFCSVVAGRMYKHLVFSGGGTRVLFFVPALVQLEKNGLLNDIKDYWGTSAGALLAAYLALTHSAAGLHAAIHDIQYTKFRDIDPANIFDMAQSWGMDDGHSLVHEIERIFETCGVGFGKKTMGDVPNLHIIVSDLNSHEILDVNSISYPDVRISEAIRASMGVPFMYKPYKHVGSGHYWIDGALKANFPWDLLPDDAARKAALGFTFDKSWIHGPRTFTDYMFSMIHFDEPKKMSLLKRTWPKNILWFPPPKWPAWFMTLNNSDFQLIDSIGSNIFNEWFISRQKDGSAHPLDKTGTQPVCEGLNTRPLASPADCITELSDNRLPCPAPCQDSFRPQLPSIRPSYRRWSV